MCVYIKIHSHTKILCFLYMQCKKEWCNEKYDESFLISQGNITAEGGRGKKVWEITFFQFCGKAMMKDNRIKKNT